MSIDGLMRTSVSGMQAQSNRLGAVAGNIANASTVGYKRVDTQFATLLAEATPTSVPAMGVETISHHLVSSQGILQSTTSRFDLAVNGEGFMPVAGADGDPVLTRAGAFVPDASGRLINAAGYVLLGTPITSGIGGTALALGDLTPVVVGGSGVQASPSTAATLAANLPALASPIAPTDLPSANASTSVSTARTSLVTYGNLGETLTLDVHFSRTTSPGEWEIAIFNAADRSTSGGFPYANPALASLTISFDANGMPGPSAPTSISVPVPGGATVDVDLGGTTQLAADFTVVNADANGHPAGGAAAIEIDGKGIVSEIFASGTRRVLFQIPIAAVNSPDNLVAIDGNAYRPSSMSGNIRLGIPDSAGYGSLVSGALETSTVDMASELTDMISAQRNYTANSRVFQTGAEIMEIVVNLKR